MSQHKYTNKLIDQSSPYLLQHAHNPVDWHPWGEEALKKAKDENKLLIVSIGYAACHWCHVMEHESFEDSTVAAMMNEHFIPIKVDREERPDIDDIYMSAAQLVSGRGGWPLNAFALPDGRPVWAGTYFPKQRWMDILKQFADLKHNNFSRLVSSAEQLTAGIKSLDIVEFNAVRQEYTPAKFGEYAKRFVTQIDQQDGGRRGAPKFPMPNNYEFLLKYATENNDQAALESVETTLDKMAMGGIYDQIGGGFARYSVDEIWKVPHFEKMLYDNGQLVSLYSKAFQVFKKPLYEKVVHQSIAFVERELMSDEGGFFSSLDADSEGEEGIFYLWSDAEINELIPSKVEQKIFKDYYSAEPQGNWEHNSNILHVSIDPEQIAKDNNLSLEELKTFIERQNNAFLAKRSERIRPGLDDKILTSWHSLMIKGYVDAYRSFGNKEYLEQAILSGHFILKNQMQADGRLNRNFKDGVSTINAFLDDYAALAEALLALYEVTFDESWINVAKDIIDYTIEHFYDGSNGMFNYTSDIDPPLIARKLELTDNVIPASNSMMGRALYRLGEVIYEEGYTKKSEQLLRNLLPTIEQSQSPSFYSNWLQLYFEFAYPAFEIAVVGEDAHKITQELMQPYSSNNLYVGSTQNSDLPLLKDKYSEGSTLIYVCQNKVCKFPVSEISEARKLMVR